MFNISPYCCRVLIENISKNSKCVSLKPFILLSTYASAIYQVVLWEDLAALKPLQVIPGEPIVRFQEPHSLWNHIPVPSESNQNRSPKSYIDELTQIYHTHSEYPLYLKSVMALVLSKSAAERKPTWPKHI